MDEIIIEERLPATLTNGLLIIAFPTRGLVSTIAGRYLIDARHLEEIGWISSEDLIPAAIIHQGTALPPIRIYATTTSQPKLAVIVSEFPIPDELIMPLTHKILNWATLKELTTICTFEGIKNSTKPAPQIYGIATTPYTRHLLSTTGIPTTSDGIVLGLNGVLLYTSAINHHDTLCLLAHAHASYPDSRAAATLIDHVGRLFPNLKVDLAPLYQEADEIEHKVRMFLEETRPTSPNKPKPITQMYA